MKKLRSILIVVFTAIISTLALLSASNFVIKGEVSDLVGVISAEAVPDWVKGHEETVKDKFVAAYNAAGFTVEPTNTVKPIDLAKARVLLYQRIGDEGAIFLNEVEGKAFITTNKDMLDVIDGLPAENVSILLAVVESEGVEYFISDNAITSLDEEGNPITYAYGVGRGVDIVYWDVVLNDFTKAYKFAQNYYETGLGLPLSPVTMEEYNTFDLNSNGTYKETKSIKKHYIQKFDNGYIIQARMTNLEGANLTVQHGAAPILNDMYVKVVALEGNADLSVTGAPVSIQYVIDGITYQNFEYGYVKVVDGVATFVKDLVVDSQGTEMNRRIGAGESFNNWNKTHNKDVYQISWERLRVGQNFRNRLGKMIRDGRSPYKTSEADPLGNGRIHHVPHEFNGVGVVHIFKDGWGIVKGWGNVFITQGYWYNEVQEYAPPFNVFIDDRVALGRPSQEWTTLYNASYQVFEKGVAYTDGVNAAEFKAGDDFVAWLNGETVEQALVRHGIASSEHEVKFVDHDDTVLKTETVPHGDAATPPANPTRDHYVFDKWDKAFDKITNNLVVKAVYKALDYSITYELDGGINDIDNPNKFNITSNIELKPAEKDGFIFDGWYLETEHTNKITKIEPGKFGNLTLYARYIETVELEDILGVFREGSTIPGWVVGHEDTVKAKFTQAYTDAGFSVVPNEYLNHLDLGKARVALFQIFGDEGAILLNETAGRPIVIKNKAAVDAWLALTAENRGIILAEVAIEDDVYYVMDNGILDKTLAPYTYAVGVGGASGLVGHTVNDFTKAYKFSQNYMEPLGLPKGEVIIKKYKTKDLQGNGKYADPIVNTEKDYYFQEFTNGYIIMGQQTRNVQFGGAPILKPMYDLVVALEGNADLSVTGAPVSIQFLIDGVIYQNFEYGHVKVVEGVATFVPDLVVDKMGTPVNRRIGAGESFNNWNKAGVNADEYFVAYERLRVGQNFRNRVGQMIRDGRPPYIPSEADPLGDGRFHHVPHEFDGVGVVHIFFDGWGEKIGWGNCFIVQGVWYNEVQEFGPPFNNMIHERAVLGRPSAEWTTLYNATYQLFEKGIAFTDGETVGFKYGEDYVTWLDGKTDEEALVAHGIAEEFHTVKWLNFDGTVLKEELVKHGESAIPPTEDPVRVGYEFDYWDVDYSIIKTPNYEIKAVFSLEQGNPETGKEKFINFDVTGSTGEFWYEDIENVIEVNELLFNAWRARKENVKQAIAVSGLPIYADDTNLVTTLKWFYIDGDVVKTKSTIGELPINVDLITEYSKAVLVDADVRRIIQDSFGDAYIFAWDRGGHQLGLPTSAVRVIKEYPNIADKDKYYDVLVQDFEHGKIIQVGYNSAAYPIYDEMLTTWAAEDKEGTEGINGIGAPTSRQYTFEGKTFQNFRYGYITLEENKDPDIEYVGDPNGIQLDFYGNEVDARFGRWIDRSVAKKAHPDFEHEFLRTYEAYIEIHSRYRAEGYVFNLLVEGSVIAWNSYGASQGFSMSSSTANEWAQTRFTPIPFRSPFDQPHLVRNGILTQYAASKGNEAGGPGFPIDDDYIKDVSVQHDGKTLTFEVNYQNFEFGYIRAYTVNDRLVTEYFVDYWIEDGKHVDKDGVESEIPALNLTFLEETPGIDKAELISKLNGLKTARAGINELVGDIKKLPNDKLYMEKTLLTEIDNEITRLTALSERDDLSEEEISTALIDIQAQIVKITNQSKPGQAVPGTGDGKDNGLSLGAILGIVGGVVAVLAIGAFLVFKFGLKKKF